MKLVQATVLKHPREVTTKYGQRSVLDCLTRDGEQLTVWRRGGDLEVLATTARILRLVCLSSSVDELLARINIVV